MTVYIIYIIIILVTIILYFLLRNKKEFLKKLGIISIVVGIIMLLIGITINLTLNIYLNNFNITKVSKLLLNKFSNSSTLFLIIGIIELIISKLIYSKEEKTRNNTKK